MENTSHRHIIPPSSTPETCLGDGYSGTDTQIGSETDDVQSSLALIVIIAGDISRALNECCYQTVCICYLNGYSGWDSAPATAAAVAAGASGNEICDVFDMSV